MNDTKQIKFNENLYNDIMKLYKYYSKLFTFLL